jgi:hypothetical protein
MRAEVISLMVSGAISPAGAAATNVFVLRDGTEPLTGNWDVGNFDLTGQNITMSGTASITGVTTFADESLTSTQISGMLLFGSANREYVPCVFEYGDDGVYYIDSVGFIRNVDGTDGYASFCLPKPIDAGGLSLKIDAVKTEVRLADANDYIDYVYLKELGSGGGTTLWSKDVTYNSAFDSNTETFSAVTPTEERVIVQLKGVFDAADGCAISSVACRCYYA